MSKTVTETIPAKYHFNDVEKLELGQKLALTNQKIAQIEDEKKRITSDYKAKLDSAQADANLLSNNLTNGYEMRPTECEVQFSPAIKRKTYYSVQTGEVVLETDMHAGDFQMHFPNWGKEKGAK